MLKVTEMCVCGCVCKIHHSQRKPQKRKTDPTGLAHLPNGLLPGGLSYWSELGDCLRKVLFFEVGFKENQKPTLQCRFPKGLY